VTHHLRCFQVSTFEIYILLPLELNKQEIVRIKQTNKNFNKRCELNYQQGLKNNFNNKN